MKQNAPPFKIWSSEPRFVKIKRADYHFTVTVGESNTGTSSLQPTVSLYVCRLVLLPLQPNTRLNAKRRKLV